jgi:Uma2 family endonuclease
MHSPTGLMADPLTPTELERRWVDIDREPRYRDHVGKVELTQWGEVLLSPPVGMPHGSMAVHLARLLEDALGGRCVVEVGVITDAGIRAPDVLWCSDAYLEAHPEQVVLRAAPELCIEIVSPTDSMKQLREKMGAYLRAGAREAWIVDPVKAAIELYGESGRLASSGFPVEIERVFGR